MNRIEAAAKAYYETEVSGTTYEQAATDILAAADAPVLALIEEAENRLGSHRCVVTTYELRKALGQNVDNWPENAS